MSERARPPQLVIRLELEGVPHVTAECDSYGDQLRLARYVDELLCRRLGLLNEMVAAWLTILEEESAA